MLCLAQSGSPDAVHFLDVVKSLGILVTLAVSLVTLVMLFLRTGRAEKRELLPQPLEVRGSTRLLDVDLHRQCQAGFEHRVTGLESDLKTLRAELKSDRLATQDLIRHEVGRVHGRLDDLVKHLMTDRPDSPAAGEEWRS
jgi:hypothetical protein